MTDEDTLTLRTLVQAAAAASKHAQPNDEKVSRQLSSKSRPKENGKATMKQKEAKTTEANVQKPKGAATPAKATRASVPAPATATAPITDASTKKPTISTDQLKFAKKNEKIRSEWWKEDGKDLRCIVSEGKKWFDLIPNLEDGAFETNRVDKSAFESIMRAMPDLFQREVSRYKKLRANSNGGSDQKWINDVIESGTLSDRIAALALRVQESPVHELESLDQLLDMAARKEQRMAQLALEALKDLMIHNLLPDNRSLVLFKRRPLGHALMTQSVALVLWFEEQLSYRVEKFVEALDLGLRSTVDYFKKVCMGIAESMLESVPEQEARLLSLLVNKLGDPSGSISSKCSELLRLLIHKHPAMKICLVREARELVCRASSSPRVVFAGVVFLSQIKLSANAREDQCVAEVLVETYVSLFEKALAAEELGSRLLTALLNGINRAFAFVKSPAALRKHTDSLFRIAQTTSFSTATQALVLLLHILFSTSASSDSKNKSKNKSKSKIDQNKPVNADSAAALPKSAADHGDGVDTAASGSMEDRFYRALYAKLLCEEVSERV